MTILFLSDAIAKRIRAVARVRTELVREAFFEGSYRPHCGRSDPTFDFSEVDMSFCDIVIDNRDPEYGDCASLG